MTILKKNYLYVASAPTYKAGEYSVKIGITNNHLKRIIGLRKQIDWLMEYNAVYHFENIAQPLYTLGKLHFSQHYRTIAARSSLLPFLLDSVIIHPHDFFTFTLYGVSSEATRKLGSSGRA
jgi:hypothetical protein